MTLPIQLAARKYPDQLAYDDGIHQIRYSELEDALSKLWVSNVGLEPGDHVAWCPRNDFESFLIFWALQRMGCVACPISHRFPDAKRSEVVHRIDAKWLPELSESTDRETESKPADLTQPATIILSSGSTGVPKAIVHSMAAHIASAKGAAINMPLASGDRWFWSLPLCHVSGLSILVRCAVAGATVFGTPAESGLNAKLLDDSRVTHLSVVTTQLRRLLSGENFPSNYLKAVLLGGSSVDETMVEEARKRGVPVSTTYGLSETASQVTTSTAHGDPATSGKVLDGRELKVSESGEILVRGATLCLGYYVDGEIKPVVDGEEWFHTKDLGELDAKQQLIVKGRIDNMFISGGENIHPEAIERTMMSVFDINQVIVVPAVDAEFGSRPVAFVDGELPVDWRSVLEEKVKRYEVPAKILPWPAEAEGAIKPNRKKLQDLV